MIVVATDKRRPPLRSRGQRAIRGSLATRHPGVSAALIRNASDGDRVANLVLKQRLVIMVYQIALQVGGVRRASESPRRTPI